MDVSFSVDDVNVKKSFKRFDSVMSLETFAVGIATLATRICLPQGHEPGA